MQAARSGPLAQDRPRTPRSACTFDSPSESEVQDTRSAHPLRETRQSNDPGRRPRKAFSEGVPRTATPGAAATGLSVVPVTLDSMTAEPIERQPSFDAAGYLMRVRRSADLSQRDLASRIGVSQPTLARWETGASSPRLQELVTVLRCAGLHLQVVDADGSVVEPFGADGARDNRGRRYPAHLDVFPQDLRPPDPWWGAPSNLRPSPGWCVRRSYRDLLRADAPTQADHPTGEELQDRAEQITRREAEQRAERSAALRARRTPRPEPEPCFCPDRCYEVGLCVPECECRCD